MMNTESTSIFTELDKLSETEINFTLPDINLTVAVDTSECEVEESKE